MWAVVIKKMNHDQLGVGMSTDQIAKHLKYVYDKYLSQLDLLIASVTLRKAVEASTQPNIPGSNASTEMSAVGALAKSPAHLTPEQQAALDKVPVPTQDSLREATAFVIETKQQISISNGMLLMILFKKL